MPLYEYECGRCGHRFEAIQKFSDPLIETCPKCEGPVRKLVASPAFQFKGSGWYITDYARKDQGDAKKPEAGAPETAAGEKGAEKAADKAADKASPSPTKETKDKPGAASGGSGSDRSSGPAAKPS